MVSDGYNAARTTDEATVAPEGGGRYRPLAGAGGEPQQVRSDLLTAPHPSGRSTSLLRFVHLTDFQLADLASPGRLEFLQELAGREEWADMLPAYRPQEFLSLHAFEAMARTLRELAAVADSGMPVSFAITTGDNTDNAALNEVRAFMSLMDGGAELDPTFGVSDRRAIPSYTESGPYWNPEPESRDDYKNRYGFPDRPGALAAAARPIDAAGLGMPWLACFGNHDCLAQGRAIPTEGFQRLVTGTRRPTRPPVPLPLGAPMETYVADPTFLSADDGLSIEGRADRRVVSKAEYIRAHLDSVTGPEGHGFTDDNLRDGTAYYCHDDVPGVRVIVLDSTNPAGGVAGSIGARQRAWLVERLIETHAEYRDEDGRVVETSNADRLIIIASHHGLSMMNNDLDVRGRSEPCDADRPRYLAADIEALLHRFGNVVLWLTGHIHRNLVIPRPGASGGFWELCTSAMAEWPVQSRLLELRLPDAEEAPPTWLVIRSTMIDHKAPARPTGALDLWDLASLHREVAANEPTRVGGAESAGTLLDRNVDLLVPIAPALGSVLASGQGTSPGRSRPTSAVRLGGEQRNMLY